MTPFNLHFITVQPAGCHVGTHQLRPELRVATDKKKSTQTERSVPVLVVPHFKYAFPLISTTSWWNGNLYIWGAEIKVTT